MADLVYVAKCDGGKFRHEWFAVAHVYLLSKRERGSEKERGRERRGEEVEGEELTQYNHLF